MALERSKCVVDGGSKVGLDGCKLFIVVVSVADKDVAVVVVAIAAGRDFDEEDFILI